MLWRPFQIRLSRFGLDATHVVSYVCSRRVAGLRRHIFQQGAEYRVGGKMLDAIAAWNIRPVAWCCAQNTGLGWTHLAHPRA